MTLGLFCKACGGVRDTTLAMRLCRKCFKSYRRSYGEAYRKPTVTQFLKRWFRKKFLKEKKLYLAMERAEVMGYLSLGVFVAILVFSIYTLNFKTTGFAVFSQNDSASFNVSGAAFENVSYHSK